MGSILPAMQGTIKRRLLVNYRADPGQVRKLLPEEFRPKLHRGFAIVGICLIRLEHMRPAGMPAALGITSENAAHRVAVEWDDRAQEGVFVLRRDTDSLLNRIAAGRLFPGEQHGAKFEVQDNGDRVDLAMHSADHQVAVRVVGRASSVLSTGSCFESPEASSNFFEGGSVGYSLRSRDERLDRIRLETAEWRARPFAVERVESSLFDDPAHFPAGSIEFDHALVMRDIEHVWHSESANLAAATTAPCVA